MAWTKVKTAALVGLMILLTAGAATVAVKEIVENHAYAWEIRSSGKADWKEPRDMLTKVPPQVHIVPTKFPDGISGGWAHLEGGMDGRQLGIKTPFNDIVQAAYQVQFPKRINYEAGVPPGEYDYISNLPHRSTEALQKEIKRKFGLDGKFETIETNALVLRVKSPGSPGLKPKSSFPFGTDQANGLFNGSSPSMTDLARDLENVYFKIPIIYQTGIKGGFGFQVVWDANKNRLENLKKALADQLGLELVPCVEPVKFLVMNKG